MFDLPLTELRSIVKDRNIKGYKSLDKDELLKTLNISVKTVKEIDLSSLSLSELKLIPKFRRINNYEIMFKDELLNVFKNSVPFKGITKIRKENRNENKIIRDLRILYKPEEDDDDYIKYESNGNKNKALSIEDYLNMIRPYLSNVIDDHKDG